MNNSVRANWGSLISIKKYLVLPEDLRLRSTIVSYT